MIRFFVPGRPVPKARPRVGKRGTYTPKTTVTWERTIALAAVAAHPGKRPWFSKGGVAVEFCFYGASPRADIDNLAKAALDALNGIVYADDHQVFHLCVWKNMGTDAHAPGVEVRVDTRDFA